MTPRVWWTTVAAAALSIACGDIGAPTRDDLYEWRLEAPDPSGDGVDTISFHWPAERLPVRVWVEPTDPLPEDVSGAITTWQDEFLYGEYKATVVADSSGADVIVRSGPPPGPVLSVTRLRANLAPQCSGATDVSVSDDHTQLRLPIRVYLNPQAATGTPGLEECLALTTIHEIGHSLGIFRHSPNPSDIMYFNPSVAAPSASDRHTAEALYHFPSTVEAVGP